jgi:thioredoxin reductase
MTTPDTVHTTTHTTTYDIVVIGGGAAGLSAALVLARARRRVLVLDEGNPRNAPAAHLHGYLSRDGMPPADLLARGRDEVRSYGGVVRTGRATQVVPFGVAGLSVLVDDGSRLAARRVLVTTGLRDELPAVAGLTDRWARDVLHCPYCHGHEVRDQRLGVLGGTPESVRYALIVRQWQRPRLPHPTGDPVPRRPHPVAGAGHRGGGGRPRRS